MKRRKLQIIVLLAFVIGWSGSFLTHKSSRQRLIDHILDDIFIEVRVFSALESQGCEKATDYICAMLAGDVSELYSLGFNQEKENNEDVKKAEEIVAKCFFGIEEKE